MLAVSQSGARVLELCPMKAQLVLVVINMHPTYKGGVLKVLKIGQENVLVRFLPFSVAC